MEQELEKRCILKRTNMELIGLYLLAGLAIATLLESFGEVVQEDLTMLDRIVFITLWPIFALALAKAVIS